VNVFFQLFWTDTRRTYEFDTCFRNKFTRIVKDRVLNGAKIIRTIDILPQQYQENDSMPAWMLMKNLRHCQNNLKIYPRMTFKDAHKFNGDYSAELQEIVRGIQMDRILSLDLYSSSPPSHVVNNYLPFFLSKILPNLSEIDLSSISLYMSVLRKFFQTILGKVTWNNINTNYSVVELDGCDMVFSNNLKEIHMDDSIFYSIYSKEMSNLANSAFNNHFIFHRCCKTLERVSIRNARRHTSAEPTIISQNALFKFFRNAPSLRWFRSDLSQENMNMLRLERPGIEY
jgi:hypothetical protein